MTVQPRIEPQAERNVSLNAAPQKKEVRKYTRRAVVQEQSKPNEIVVWRGWEHVPSPNDRERRDREFRERMERSRATFQAGPPFQQGNISLTPGPQPFPPNNYAWPMNPYLTPMYQYFLWQERQKIRMEHQDFYSGMLASEQADQLRNSGQNH
ncbi:unnamed protein product [Caenorhabditis auriculariae]|uniref:Uncharacterized protein n=1 Tax=Caenorhabditis auriculariae TaxID=2777116 RepID=A0A8S1H0L9_9PELO|nr:unnamed protein product [Caenorhabditis auriculariae]